MLQNLFSYYTKNYRWCQSILPLFFIGIGCAIIWNNQYPTARIITIILMGLISISGFVDTYKKYKKLTCLRLIRNSETSSSIEKIKSK